MYFNAEKWLVNVFFERWPTGHSLPCNWVRAELVGRSTVCIAGFLAWIRTTINPTSIYAGYIVIYLDAVYRGDAEDFQPERQLIRRLLYSPSRLSFFFLGVEHNWFAF